MGPMTLLLATTAMLLSQALAILSGASLFSATAEVCLQLFSGIECVNFTLSLRLVFSGVVIDATDFVELTMSDYVVCPV